MKRFFAVLYFLLFISAFSCKKNPDDNKPADEKKSGKCYLLRAYDDESELKITYNAAMRAELLDFRVDGQSQEAYKFIYDNNGRISRYQLIAENGEIYEAIVFYNPDSTISKVEAGYENGIVEYTVGYVYNAQKQLIRVNEFRENSSTEIDNYQLYTYDAKGNLIKTEEYRSQNGGELKLYNSSEQEYDNYKNPLSELNLQVFLNDELMDLSPNNVTKETYKDSEGKVTSSTKYEYTYNTQGYPITDKSIYKDGTTYLSNLEYDCK